MKKDETRATLGGVEIILVEKAERKAMRKELEADGKAVRVFAVSKPDGERVRFLFVTGEAEKKTRSSKKRGSGEEEIRSKATMPIGAEKKGNGKGNGNGHHKPSKEGEKLRAKLAGKNPLAKSGKKEKLAELRV